MFSDSHAHFFTIFEKNGKSNSFLSEIKEKKFRFTMDIGTEPGDLALRQKFILDSFDGKIPDFMHFAAGLWPHASSILAPKKALSALNSDIETLFSQKNELKKLSPNQPFYTALGECGIDRYWNGAAALKRIEASSLIENDETGTSNVEAEEALFKQQLKLAKDRNLSVIVHSRDAYEDTLKCIDEVGHHKGVIHCFSYGLKESLSFLDRGWYISFPGNITYPKKQAEKDRIAELIRAVPLDKLLLETDAPYLTPAPFRGKVNTPLLIEYTYAMVSEILAKPMENLAEQIYENCCSCFLTK